MNYKEIIVGIGVLALLLKLDVLENPFQGTPAFVDGYSNEVVFYSTSWCGYCKKASSARGREEYDQLDGKGVPLFVINGEVVHGYDPQELIELAVADY